MLAEVIQAGPESRKIAEDHERKFLDWLAFEAMPTSPVRRLPHFFPDSEHGFLDSGELLGERDGALSAPPFSQGR